MNKSTHLQVSVPLLLKVAEVAALLNISRNTVSRLIDRGELSALYLFPGRRSSNRHHLRVTGASFAAFYEKRAGVRTQTHLKGKPVLNLAA